MTQPRQRLIRGQAHLARALTLIHLGKARTRAELTSELDVTRTTAGAITAELEALGLVVVDTRPEAAGHGRPSHRLTIAPAGPVVLAAQVHVDGYRIALVALGGEVVATHAHRGEVAEDPNRVIGDLAKAGAALLHEHGRRCAGAGLVVPSAVDSQDGRALNPVNVAWPTGAPVRDIFAAHIAAAGLNVPTFVANDINAGALAEHRHGAGRDASHVLTVATGHRGVGGAFVLAGELYRGNAGLSMEIGHIIVNPGGRPCHCGNNGCLDVEADPVAFVEAAGHELDGSPLRQAIALLAKEDPAARAAASTVLDRLATGVAGLVNVLNPGRVVLGGLYDHLDTARLAALVTERSLWERPVPMVRSALPHNALVGAAELVWQPVLDDPQSAEASAGA